MDHLLAATSLESTMASNVHLDLALVLLAAGRSQLAVQEYAKAFAELKQKTNDLRRHGLLTVGLVDLNEVRRNKVVESSPELESILAALHEQIKTCGPALATIEPLVENLRRLLSRGQQS
jgi:hypothetical protein